MKNSNDTGWDRTSDLPYTHTHTHTYIYIYMYVKKGNRDNVFGIATRYELDDQGIESRRW